MKLREINNRNLKEKREIEKRKPLINNKYYMVTIENSILNWAPKNYLGNNNNKNEIKQHIFRKRMPFEKT